MWILHNIDHLSKTDDYIKLWAGFSAIRKFRIGSLGSLDTPGMVLVYISNFFGGGSRYNCIITGGLSFYAGLVVTLMLTLQY